MKVVDKRFYDIYSGFFKFMNIFDFIKFFFLKISVFRNFGSQKLKISKFLDSEFVEHVILHLSWSFCALCLKTLFLTNFLIFSRFWSKLA